MRLTQKGPDKKQYIMRPWSVAWRWDTGQVFFSFFWRLDNTQNSRIDYCRVQSHKACITVAHAVSYSQVNINKLSNWAMDLQYSPITQKIIYYQTAVNVPSIHPCIHKWHPPLCTSSSGTMLQIIISMECKFIFDNLTVRERKRQRHYGNSDATIVSLFNRRQTICVVMNKLLRKAHFNGMIL